jgi:MoxR-like ATPase
MAEQPAQQPAEPADSLLQAVEHLPGAYQQIRREMAKVIVGQHQVLEQLMIALSCRGHCILEGVPGLAKTLMIASLARTVRLAFSRIQFTPDLMPSDITGTEVLEEDRATGTRQLRFVRGPIFANVILADEINRTPPKTQAALLEAMQEHQVTAAGVQHRLPQPFYVLATQNPIEQEGTYPLPEAQLDRFLFKVLVDYPTPQEEFDVIRLTTAIEQAPIQPVLSADPILQIQQLVRSVPCADHVIRYAMKLTRATRPHKPEAPPFIRQLVSWGTGPRASQFLVLAAKARALLHGRYHACTDDVRQVAPPVLRHRIITNFNAQAEGITPDDIVRRLIDETAVDESAALDVLDAQKFFRAP